MADPIQFDTRDLRGLERAAQKIDGIAKKQITPAVRKAMKPVLQAAKAKAPKDTRALSKALKLMGERSRTPGKKVYQVGPDKAKNDIFAKMSKAGKRSYYPASQEHGWRLPDGSKVPGKHYMRDAMDEKAPQVASDIVDNLMTEIEKEWTKRHG